MLTFEVWESLVTHLSFILEEISPHARSVSGMACPGSARFLDVEGED